MTCYISNLSTELTEASLREPLRRALAARTAGRFTLGQTVAAGVLLALFERDGEAHVWLARRPTSMRSHAGQVAFPGGKHEPGDDSLLATALRETQEELGIEPRYVDVLGALDDVRTVTGFTVSPWVGWLEPGAVVLPNATEVARAFAAPLRVFTSPPSGVLPWRGWTVDGELVWGATAAIVGGFMSLVGELEPAA